MRSPAWLLLASSLLVACSAPAGADLDTTSAGSAIASPGTLSVTRLDRVTPAEVAAVYAEGLQQAILDCVDQHPGLASITRDNVDAFTTVWSVQYVQLHDVLVAMLDEGQTSIAVSSLASAIEPWATRTMSKYVDEDGFYAPPCTGLRDFHHAERLVRRAKGLSLAAPVGGLSLNEVHDQWSQVQAGENDNLDSDWLNPVTVSRTPSADEVQTIMRLPKRVHHTSTGDTAVDAFATADGGPDETLNDEDHPFEALATLLKSAEIEEAWFFEGGEPDLWRTNYLVVLDTRGQLWGMKMGFTEECDGLLPYPGIAQCPNWTPAECR